MVPGLLLQEILTALTGAAGLWALQAVPALEDVPKRVLQGGIFACTLGLMGRFGGLW